MRTLTNTAQHLAVISSASSTASTPVTQVVSAKPAIPEDLLQFLMFNGVDERNQFELAQCHFKRYAEFGCAAPQPDRISLLDENIGNSFLANHPDRVWTLAAEYRSQQALVLHSQLLQDTPENLTDLYKIPFAGAFEGLTADALDGVRRAIENKRDALIKRQQVVLSRLQRLVVIAQALFEMMHLVVPADGFTTELTPECLSLMDKAGIDKPRRMSPVELYKALSRNLLVCEQEVAGVAMELLRDELHLARMDFYAVTGQFLKSQASKIMADDDQ